VKSPCGFSARRDLKRGFVSSHRLAARQKPKLDQPGWKRSVREVSAYSTLYRELVWGAAHRRRLRRPIWYRLKMPFDLISRCLRKTYNLPPRRSTIRQVVIPSLFQVQAAPSEHQDCSVATPPISARPF